MTASGSTSMRPDGVNARCWELLLSGEGGVVLDLLFEDQNDIVAVTRLGLFRSGDRGGHWVRIETPPLIQTLHRSGDWWLGTDAGLFRSERLDATWKPVLSRTAVTAVEVIDHSDLVLVASAEEGLLRSEDGGVSWEDANPGLPGDDIIAIHQSPQYQRDQMIFVATESGLYRSRNGGRAWRRVPIEADAIQCSEVIDHQLLIGTGGDGLWRSSDSGKSWSQSLPGQAVIDIGTSEARILVLTETELLRMDVSGDELSSSSLPPEAACALCLGDRTLIGTLSQGILQLDPGGGGWIKSSTGLEATIRDRVRAIGRSHIVTTSGSGTMLHSADNGTSWSEMPNAPCGWVNDFDVYVNGDGAVEIVVCGSHDVCTYGGNWRLIDTGSPLAVAWLDRNPAVLTQEGDFVCNDFRSSIFPWRPRLASARLYPMAERPDVVWSALHTENAGVIVLRSPDGGKRWEPLLQTDVTNAISIAVTVDVSGKEIALAAVGNQIYSVLESPTPVWTGGENIAISAIKISWDGRVLLATNYGLISVSRDFSSSEVVPCSPAPLLDVDCDTTGRAIVVERGGAIWQLR